MLETKGNWKNRKMKKNIYNGTKSFVSLILKLVFKVKVNFWNQICWIKCSFFIVYCISFYIYNFIRWMDISLTLTGKIQGELDDYRRKEGEKVACSISATNIMSIGNLLAMILHLFLSSNVIRPTCIWGRGQFFLYRPIILPDRPFTMLSSLIHNKSKQILKINNIF